MGDNEDRSRNRKHPSKPEPSGGCPHNSRTWTYEFRVPTVRTTISTCVQCKKILGERDVGVLDVYDDSGPAVLDEHVVCTEPTYQVDEPVRGRHVARNRPR